MESSTKYSDKVPILVVLSIYTMSFTFVFGSSILQFGFGSELNYATCSAATFLCLGAYVATKVVREAVCCGFSFKWAAF